MEKIFEMLEFLDESIECIKREPHAFILKYGAKIGAAAQLFADNESKYLYMQEIVFCSLIKIIHASVASAQVGFMSDQEVADKMNIIKNHQIFNMFCVSSIASSLVE